MLQVPPCLGRSFFAALYGFVLSLAIVAASTTAQETPDWVLQATLSDPLLAKQKITLDDIRQGIADPLRRSTIIDLYFPRVEDGTEEERREFLIELLKDGHPAVARQAAKQLAQMGLLQGIVRDVLMEQLSNQDVQAQLRGAIGLSQMERSSLDRPEAYWDALASGLVSTDPVIAEASFECLISEGPAAVPLLLATLRKGDDETAAVRAAQALARIFQGEAVVSAPVEMMAPAPPRSSAPRPVPELLAKPKSPIVSAPTRLERKHGSEEPTSVDVYFGTNREFHEEIVEHTRWKLLFYPFMIMAMVAGVALSWWPTEGTSRHGCLRWMFTLVLVLGLGLTLVMLQSELVERWRLAQGPSFGARRDTSGQVHYGVCTVTIPPGHEVGAIESPLWGGEDENLHVVVQKTALLEEQAFFATVKKVVESYQSTEPSCFVFIHGYNVSFLNAARRTAQIHHDLDFPGAPIFFSWPSRGSMRHYFSDRNEIAYSRFVIKQFLLDVAKRSGAQRVHVIAHSMGADATSQAIAELADEGKIFDQIILAAPDIDREVFRDQLAPRMAKTAGRMTLYCSKNDWALIASKTFNDAPRAGDSSIGALVLDDVDTVDASEIDTDLLGHSYFGDCVPLLDDVRQLFYANRPPMERSLIPWPVGTEKVYWTLPDANVDNQQEVPDPPLESTPPEAE